MKRCLSCGDDYIIIGIDSDGHDVYGCYACKQTEAEQTLEQDHEFITTYLQKEKSND